MKVANIDNAAKAVSSLTFSSESYKGILSEISSHLLCISFIGPATTHNLNNHNLD